MKKLQMGPRGPPKGLRRDFLLPLLSTTALSAALFAVDHDFNSFASYQYPSNNLAMGVCWMLILSVKKRRIHIRRLAGARWFLRARPRGPYESSHRR